MEEQKWNPCENICVALSCVMHERFRQNSRSAKSGQLLRCPNPYREGRNTSVPPLPVPECTAESVYRAAPQTGAERFCDRVSSTSSEVA